MFRILSKLIFKISGWKIGGEIPPKRCVMVGAPHTSNADFFNAIPVFFILRLKLRYLAKKELFKFPFGLLFKATGGIPVDRSKKNMRMVDTMIELFNQYDDLVLLIPVEGTRGYVKEWKTGFYHVAVGAKVPIALGYLDYSKKEAGFGPTFWPTGDKEKDIAKIKEFYRGVKAKYPEKSSLHEPENSPPLI
ncbi:MAG TPA: lysophospholipid acyltransferase family protein [Cytophagales bacterium]|nr:lysophospholipid acyltransferase family protein [Cytophagales bacterium]